jgi:hypothetical protein
MEHHVTLLRVICVFFDQNGHHFALSHPIVQLQGFVFSGRMVN